MAKQAKQTRREQQAQEGGRARTQRAKPHFRLERAAIRRGLSPVCGLDEAGRGPLAGPVVAACVALNPKAIPDGIDDSKRLTEEARRRLRDELMLCAAVGVGMATVEEIDAINVYHATFLAMRRAFEAMPEQPAFALVDGNHAPDIACECRTVVGGDSQILSIAAASIIAKVARDEIMMELDARYPGYGFAAHKGYAVPAHKRALASLGPCPAHRASFAPVREALRKGR